MYVLNEQQVNFILSDIRRRGVETEDLQYNLLDHICCIVETEMDPETNFEEFYRGIIPRFFKRELREIEEETQLLLTFKHYYAMKKTMITSGTIAVAVFLTGSIFKIMHWPGAGVMLFSGIFIISFLFLPLMFILKVREITATRDKIILALGTIIGITFSLSALFKVQHWPGATILWQGTLAILFFLFIPIYFFSGIRNPETKVNTTVSTILLIAVGGVFFTLTSIKPSYRVTMQRLYSYVQNQELLRQMQRQVPGNNMLIEDINRTCEEMKGMVLRHDLGLNEVPADFDMKDIVLYEGGLGPEFYDNGKGLQLLETLKSDIDKYNTTLQGGEPKLNLTHSFMDIDLRTVGALYSNYGLLNDLTQLQMFLAYQQNKVVIK